MNQLSTKDRAKILSCLVEGNSIRATCRMTGRDKGAVLKLLADVGAACKRYYDEHVFMLQSQRIQVDEIWSFRYTKETTHQRRSTRLPDRCSASVWQRD